VENSNILLTVVEPDHPNFDFNTLHDKLYVKGFTIYPGLLTHNTFRIAVMGAIDSSDIKNFLKVLNEVLAELGVNLLSQ
jgi:aspartate aminotransferase-like enzyme